HHEWSGGRRLAHKISDFAGRGIQKRSIELLRIRKILVGFEPDEICDVAAYALHSLAGSRKPSGERERHFEASIERSDLKWDALIRWIVRVIGGAPRKQRAGSARELASLDLLRELYELRG